MTAAVARWGTHADHPLVEDYARFCHELGVTDRALRDRLRLARAFLGQHRDLDAWLARPTRARLADLQRIGRGRWCRGQRSPDERKSTWTCWPPRTSAG
jgi:hypothetical protein